MKKIDNLWIPNEFGREIIFDLTLPAYNSPKKKHLLIFLHGFKGFRNWGHWDAIANSFADSGYGFLKMDYSLNGTSYDSPGEISDKNAFENNNFSTELSDTRQILAWVHKHKFRFGWDHVSLIGHSRSGPIALITAALEKQIHSVMTWASVADLSYAWTSDAFVEKWKKEGRYFVTNQRTKESYAVLFQLWEDYHRNQLLFKLKEITFGTVFPVFLAHGDNDSAIGLEDFEKLKQLFTSATSLVVKGADHVFGGTHPWISNQLPGASQVLVDGCLRFLNDCK